MSSGRQFGRYLVVGTISFSVDYGLLVLLTEVVRLHYLVSGALAFVAGVTLNYVLAVIWVFDHRRLERKWLEMAIYGGIGVVGLGLNELVLYGLSGVVGWHYAWAKLVAGVAVLVWTFFSRRAVLFSPRGEREH